MVQAVPGADELVEVGDELGVREDIAKGLAVWGVPSEEAGEVLAAGDAVAAQRGLVRGEAELALPLVDEVRVRVDRRVETREVLRGEDVANDDETVGVEQELVRLGHARVREGGEARGVVAVPARRDRPTGGHVALPSAEIRRANRAPRRARARRSHHRGLEGREETPRTDRARGKECARTRWRRARRRVSLEGCRRRDKRVRGRRTSAEYWVPTTRFPRAHCGDNLCTRRRFLSAFLPPLTLASRPSPRGFEPPHPPLPLTPSSS